jgi:phage gp37-like protein
MTLLLQKAVVSSDDKKGVLETQDITSMLLLGTKLQLLQPQVLALDFASENK